MTPTGTDGNRSRRTSPRRRRLGQHFLHDERVLSRLIKLIDPRPDDRVLEIGPGGGALTRPLADCVAHLHAVEVDSRLAAALATTLGRRRHVTIVHADVLAVEPELLWRSAADGSDDPVRVVGNLPYAVATAVIRRLVPHAALFRDLIVMVQEEVARRLVAGPGDADYGALSVEVALHAEARLAFGVRPGSFSPPPAVESRVVVMTLRALAEQPARLQAVKLAREAFSQRRKLLINALKSADHDPAAVQAALETMGRGPRVRAQELSAGDFIGLSALLADRGSGT